MSEAQINWFKEVMDTIHDNKNIILKLVNFRSLYISPNYDGRVFLFI